MEGSFGSFHSSKLASKAPRVLSRRTFSPRASAQRCSSSAMVGANSPGQHLQKWGSHPCKELLHENASACSCSQKPNANQLTVDRLQQNQADDATLSPAYCFFPGARKLLDLHPHRLNWGWTLVQSKSSSRALDAGLAWDFPLGFSTSLRLSFLLAPLTMLLDR